MITCVCDINRFLLSFFNNQGCFSFSIGTALAPYSSVSFLLVFSPPTTFLAVRIHEFPHSAGFNGAFWGTYQSPCEPLAPTACTPHLELVLNLALSWAPDGRRVVIALVCLTTDAYRTFLFRFNFCYKIGTGPFQTLAPRSSSVLFVQEPSFSLFVLFPPFTFLFYFHRTRHTSRSYIIRTGPFLTSGFSFCSLSSFRNFFFCQSSVAHPYGRFPFFCYFPLAGFTLNFYYL